MVNRGRSEGCVTCKQRRVKCDEARPKCRSCQRLGLRCGGYKTICSDLRFIDQSHKFNIKKNRNGAVGVHNKLPNPCLLAEPDTAVPFFLSHYASMGRDIRSARGFYEILIPVYCSQPWDSALSLAVSAVASEILSIWRHGPGSSQSPRNTYTQAVKHLRSAIQDFTERSKPATLLAVLTLQLYENIAAVFGLRSATRVHLDGAVSLLPFADLDHINVASAYMRRFILHTEISSAMRQNRSLESFAYSWGKDLIAAPDNPSLALDAIGALVAELQANYMQVVTQSGSVPPSQRVLMEWGANVKRIDEQLLVWSQKVPDYWQPLQLISGQDINSTIPTYRSVCEIYPSCQIASIWNLWRVQRLLLVKILLNTILYMRQSELTKYQKWAADGDFVECQHIIQELADSVCYSVPFCLGNRNKMQTIADFSDPTILLPSYHLLAPGDNKKSSHKQNHGLGMSKEAHKRHILSQGPWHIMSPLSRLLTLFSEDDNQLMSKFIRPGQHEWIREQFLRVSMVLRIVPAESGYNKEGRNSSSHGSVDTTVENLAKSVRKGALFMSGP